MKRIYFDWNVFTELKTPSKQPYIEISKALNEIGESLELPYSSAHMADLKKSLKNEESYEKYIKPDLTYLSQVSRSLYWYFDSKENKIVWIKRNALDSFEPYREKELSVEDIMDFQKTFSEIEGMEGIGKIMNDLYASIEVPFDLSSIPDDSPLKKPMQEMLQPEGGKATLLSMMKNFGKFYDEIQKDPKIYKELRNGFRQTLNLSPNMSNWKEGTWDKLDEHMSSTILNKSFTTLVNDGINQNNKTGKITFHEEFLQAYMNLDLVGFNPEDLNKKNTYSNLFNDSQHAFFGAYCDVFVSNDSNTRDKAKAIYDKYQINTEILTPKEFLKKLTSQMDKIELYNSAPNGLKLDYLVLTRVPNIDNSGFDYKVDYIDTLMNNEKTFVGTFDLTLGYVDFAKTTNLGIPFGALKLLAEWIETNLEEL